jgi:hypothetical protein
VLLSFKTIDVAFQLKYTAFLRGLNSYFLIFRYVSWRALMRISKTSLNSFSQKIDLRLSRTQPIICILMDYFNDLNLKFCKSTVTVLMTYKQMKIYINLIVFVWKSFEAILKHLMIENNFFSNRNIDKNYPNICHTIRFSIWEIQSTVENITIYSIDWKNILKQL